MKTTFFNGRRLRSLFHNLAMTLCILFSFLCSSLQSSNAMPIPNIEGSTPPQTIVYMLDENGLLEAEPDACIQQGAVFTYCDGVMLGYIDSSTGNIVDNSGNIVGCLRSVSPDSP